jgi:endonuclease/exonuclease/phosphatase family metal-dependent hydrolase
VARRRSLNLFYAPSMRNGDVDGWAAEDRGNAILASLPLTEPKAIELPYEAQRRVSVAARVAGVTKAGGEWELQVASVHFDTRSRLSRLFASLGAARLRQAEGLVEALPPAAAAVVGGDLNTWSPRALEPAIPYLLDRFPATPEQGEPTFTVGELFSRQLDYLLFRLPAPQAARVWRVDSRYGSDHYPLLGWIHFG